MLKTVPINMNGKRSVDLLLNAMIKLLGKHKFTDISITMLTKEAGVVRNTFYAHFASKEDLLSYYMYSLFIKEIDIKEFNHNFDDLARLYFKIWNKNRSFLKMLESNNLLHLLNRLSEYIDQYCEEYISGDCYPADITAPYINAIYSDVLASIVKKWMRNDYNETPEELNSIFHKLVRF